MPQLHLFVSEELASEVEKKARKHGLSVSCYLTEIVRRNVVTDWPHDFFDSTVGGWVGKSLVRPPQGEFERVVGLHIEDWEAE